MGRGALVNKEGYEFGEYQDSYKSPFQTSRLFQLIVDEPQLPIAA